jgi:alcohol dehydrogenase
MNDFEKARLLLERFKGNSYLFGQNVLPQIGEKVRSLGQKAVLVANEFPGSSDYLSIIFHSLQNSDIEIIAEIPGAAPNAPREDVYRITEAFHYWRPDMVISFGGGSTIDAVKSAEVLRTLGGSIDDFFGTGLVSRAMQASEKQLHPHIAIQTAASSAAHLTKYSNITDIATRQKKLVVDPAIIPLRPVFDYTLTRNAPPSLTADGALDGISHALEVLYSAVGKPEFAQVAAVAETCIRLVINYLPVVLRDPHNDQAREALGLATDLGGYAIMLGGTNGAHLTSFSLVDILPHGRACGMLNPYYTVFFAPAIEEPLHQIGQIYRKAGYTHLNLDQLHGRDLGLAVAEAMISFEKAIGFPTTLQEVPGFTDEHIHKALTAAKDPQLKMKLENMPIRLTAEMVDEFMGPILQAAKMGDLHLIKNSP